MVKSGPRGRCQKPANFPEYCTLLLKEGEPNDYLAERGFVSVLGILRKSQPGVVPNFCVIKNIHRTSTLCIEFVDEGLNTFTLSPAAEGQPPTPDAFVKLDVRCTKLE